MRKKVKVYRAWATRYVKKFLWRPILLGDEQRWLEWAYTEQRYWPTRWFEPRWVDVAWATKEDYKSDDF